MDQKDVYGLIGKSLAHSFSPAYFNQKFEQEQINAQFLAFELSENEAFPQVLQTPQLKGLCVTIPYKTSIIPYLDRLSEAAREVGAVNCIALESGQLIGHNTDVVGFEASLKPLLNAQHSEALVLGTGGASKAVQYVLNRLGIPFQIVSRKAGGNSLSYAAINKELLQTHRLIINTTPVGTFPETDQAPDLPYDWLSKEHLLYDLVYNPPQTLFMQNGRRAGAQVKNGYEMLVRQAEENWKIWQDS